MLKSLILILFLLLCAHVGVLDFHPFFSFGENLAAKRLSRD